MATYFNINYELSPEAVLSRIEEAVESGTRASYVCVADGNILQMVHNDAAYRAVVNGSMFSICDSSWVPFFLKKLYGLDVPQYCGSQIFRDLVASRRYRMYFLGSNRSILAPLKSELSSKYNPDVVSMTFEELPYLPADAFDYPEIARRINEDNPDIVWISLGAPKQEIFMSRLTPLLDRGVVIAVGAAFKFFSGVSERRAPSWVVKARMEFAWRVFQEPGKQLRRCGKIVRALPRILREERRRG